MNRLLRGEQAAYRDLVATHQGAMLAVAYAIVGRGHADDVVQEAWLAIVRGIGYFQWRSSLKTWMLTITSNTAKGRYKARRNEANCIAWIDGGGRPRTTATRWRTRTVPKRCSARPNSTP